MRRWRPQSATLSTPQRSDSPVEFLFPCSPSLKHLDQSQNSQRPSFPLDSGNTIEPPPAPSRPHSLCPQKQSLEIPQTLISDILSTLGRFDSQNLAPLSRTLDSSSMECESSSPPPRLSLKHGASLEGICSYMTAVAASLRNRQILKVEDTWQPSTPSVKDHYSFIREIGRGHFGVVRLCEEKTSKALFACKTILKSSIKKEEDVTELCSEVVAMLRLQHRLTSHQHIVQLQEVMDDVDSIHLILNYCGGGDLFDHISHQKKLTEKESALILKQLISAVRSMHACGVVHRDLKPENILMARPKGVVGQGFAARKPEVKVADFGLCVVLRPGQHARGVAGSPFYMAPEVIRGKPYGSEVDTWSLGVILYTCLAGSLPFWGRGHEAVFSAVLKGRLDFVKKPWPLISPEAKHLIRSMLNPDPVRRISLEDVLTHPWMQHHCPELKNLTESNRFWGFHYPQAQRPQETISQQSASQSQQQQHKSSGQHLGQSQQKGAWASRYVVSPLASLLASQEASNPACQAVARPAPSLPPTTGKENVQGATAPLAPGCSAQSTQSTQSNPSCEEEGRKEGAPRAGQKRQPEQPSPSPQGLAKRSLSPSPFSKGLFSPLQASSQRYGSPTWVMQLAAHRVQQAGKSTGEASSENTPGKQRQDLHMIPSPPRAHNPLSPCSSPSLLHKVQAALSLAHPFPRLYLPSNVSSQTPVLSPFLSPVRSVFRDGPQPQEKHTTPLSLLLSHSEDTGSAAEFKEPSALVPVRTTQREGSLLSLATGGARGGEAREEGKDKGKEAFKKLTVFISSPTCLSPVDSCQMSPDSAAEMAEALRLEDQTRGAVGTSAASSAAEKLRQLVYESPFSLADNLVSSLFSPTGGRA